jgi:hypothetical protein
MRRYSSDWKFGNWKIQIIANNPQPLAVHIEPNPCQAQDARVSEFFLMQAGRLKKNIDDVSLIVVVRYMRCQFNIMTWFS